MCFMLQDKLQSPEDRKIESPEVRKKIQIQVGELGSREVRKEERKHLV